MFTLEQGGWITVHKRQFPVGVGVGTSLVWAVDQTLSLPVRVWLRETRFTQLCKTRPVLTGIEL